MKKLLLTAAVIAALTIVFGNQAALAQMEMGRRGRGGASQSDARQAASRVVAVADQRTNSLVISAPEELMPLIEDVIAQIDGAAADNTQVRVFPLRYADATEMAQTITNAFDVYGSSRQRGGGGRRGGFRGTTQSQRQMEEDMVIAVADIRTNSVVVTAVTEKMKVVEKMIEGLDSDPAKDRKVFIYPIENADPQSVQEILQNMFQGQSGTRRSTTNRSTTTRQTDATQRPASSSQSGGTSGRRPGTTGGG
jgi:type II secretory pathway component GspD/PulD (secretin)